MKRLAIAAMIAAAACAADIEEHAVRRKFHSVAAQANAYRKTLDHLEDRVAAMGFSLHPDLASVRVRLELSLDRAEGLLADREWKEAEEETERARAYLTKLSKSM